MRVAEYRPRPDAEWRPIVCLTVERILGIWWDSDENRKYYSPFAFRMEDGTLLIVRPRVSCV